MVNNHIWGIIAKKKVCLGIFLTYIIHQYIDILIFLPPNISIGIGP